VEVASSWEKVVELLLPSSPAKSLFFTKKHWIMEKLSTTKEISPNQISLVLNYPQKTKLSRTKKADEYLKEKAGKFFAKLFPNQSQCFFC